MDVKVTVLTPSARRQIVKVTRNTTLLQILEEVCQKHGLDCDEYALKHHNKDVDLTQMFRFSGLPNNCLLEMSQTERKRVASNVDICVQLEDGSRTQGQFKPSDNLWYVVEQLNADAASQYSSPVAIYMRQDIIGKEKMSQTLLKSLGITEGRALIRFINKSAEELRNQASVYIAPAIKEKSSVEDDADKPSTSKTRAASGGGGFAITKELVQSLKKTSSNVATGDDDAMENKTETNNVARDNNEPVKPKYDWGTGTGHTIRTAKMKATSQDSTTDEPPEEEMEIEPEINIIGDRNAIIYSLDDVTQKQQIEDLPDSFFDLTVNDLKLVLRDLKKIASGTDDAPLLTEKLRELEENKTMLNKIAQYKNCVIRVRFSDHYVLQGMFKPIETIADVAKFIRPFLQDDNIKFSLFTIPPKRILPMDKTLLELDFVPTAVVYFALEDESIDKEIINIIKSEFLNRLTTIDGAIYAANKFRMTTKKPEDDGNAVMIQRQNDDHRQMNASTGAIPKRPRNIDGDVKERF